MEEDKSDDPCVEYVHSDVGRDHIFQEFPGVEILNMFTLQQGFQSEFRCAKLCATVLKLRGVYKARYRAQVKSICVGNPIIQGNYLQPKYSS